MIINTVNNYYRIIIIKLIQVDPPLNFSDEILSRVSSFFKLLNFYFLKLYKFLLIKVHNWAVIKCCVCCKKVLRLYHKP